MPVWWKLSVYACIFHQAEAADESPEKEIDEEDEEGRLATMIISYISAGSNECLTAIIRVSLC